VPPEIIAGLVTRELSDWDLNDPVNSLDAALRLNIFVFCASVNPNLWRNEHRYGNIRTADGGSTLAY